MKAALRFAPATHHKYGGNMKKDSAENILPTEIKAFIDARNNSESIEEAVKKLGGGWNTKKFNTFTSFLRSNKVPLKVFQKKRRYAPEVLAAAIQYSQAMLARGRQEVKRTEG